MTHELKKELAEVTKEVSHTAKQISWQRVWVWVISFVVVLGLLIGGMISYASSYEDRVLSGVSIGDVHVGGMTRDELHTFLQEMNDKLVDAGITLLFDHQGTTEQIHIETRYVSADTVIELISMDIGAETQALLSYQKEGNLLVRGWSALLARVLRPQLELTTVTLDTARMKTLVTEQLAPYSQEARNASIVITDLSPLTYDVVTSSVGVVFSSEDIVGRIVSAWNALRVPEIVITQQVQHPTVKEADLDRVVDRLASVVTTGDMTLTYTDSATTRDYAWKITPQLFAPWLEVQKQGEHLGFGLAVSSTTQFLAEEIGEDINIDAREARFEIGANGKVTEFQGSRPGVAIDLAATYDALNTAFFARSIDADVATSSLLPIVVTEVEPLVATDEVNDLGITEVLGTGYSNFSGSPANRIKNIRFAVEQKLHGTLIKPGEEFSLLQALAPFTIEGGYLPELVIKGDEIKPEIGGGLCQVGSTLFRAVMNAGLAVTQRRNHSLVVSYYNDHRNGNPGTDATIYDPAPDFRFVNDTGNYILLSTDMRTNTGELFFTFWGTSDGREAYYTEPVVHRWIPTGPEQIIETTDLAPGVRNCQSAHPGAETSFTYVRTMANGEKEEVVYSSYYRPLPRICLVGAAVAAPPCDPSTGTACAEEGEIPPGEQPPVPAEGTPPNPEEGEEIG